MNLPLPGRLVAALFVAGLVVAGCGDDDTGVSTDDAADTSPTTADAGSADSTATTAATTTGQTSTATEAEGTVLEVTVADGEVTGGGRHQVALGETVTIRVSSDTADHVHLHGYDVMVDVAAGATADLTFEATIPGVFEVELEDSAIPLLEVEVS